MKEEIKTLLRENLKSTITKLMIFDFDGTLVNTPTPDTGKQAYKDKTGKDWPHKGWWSKPETLDQSIFDMDVTPEVIAAYHKAKSEPNTFVIMMTGRMQRLSKHVEAILKDKGLTFDKYIYNNGGSTLDSKLVSLEAMLKEFPEVNEVEMFDDRISHVPEFEKWGASKPDLKFKINLVNPSDH